MPQRRGRRARAAAMRRRMIAAGIALALVGAVVAGVVLLTGGENGDENGTTATRSPGAVGRIEVDETVEIGGITFFLEQVACGLENVIGEETIPAEGEFCNVDVDVTNDGDAPATLDLECQTLTDGAGTTHRPHRQASLMIEDTRSAVEVGMQPGDILESLVIIYDVPELTDATSVTFHASCDDDGVTIEL